MRGAAEGSDFCEDRLVKVATSVQARRALVLFALMSVIWGIPYLLIRVAVAEISPATLVFARTGIGTLVLLPIALLRTDVRSVLERWRWVVAFAVVEIGVPWVLLGSAEQHVTSSLAGLLVAGVPLVGTVIAVGSGSRDRVGTTGLVGLLVGLAGVAAIIGVNLGTSDTTALLEIGVVVVGYAVGPAILARRLAGLSSVGVMALSLSLCALVYAPVAVLQRPAAVPSADVLAAVAILGVVCTALAFVLFSALIDEIGPVRATVITYINPAVAALLGVVVLSESFTAGMAIGFGLVILGSTLATRPARPGAADPQVAIGDGRPAQAGADEPVA
jgi:drug/metabolite transporter (DMT)-like permease